MCGTVIGRWPIIARGDCRSLASDEFSLRLQPITDVATSRVRGVEKLLRGRRLSGEDWPFQISNPEADRRGLMEPIRIWIFHAADKAAVDLSAVSSFGINLSAAILGEGVAEIVTGTVKNVSVAPHAFILRLQRQHCF